MASKALIFLAVVFIYVTCSTQFAQCRRKFSHLKNEKTILNRDLKLLRPLHIRRELPLKNFDSGRLDKRITLAETKTNSNGQTLMNTAALNEHNRLRAKESTEEKAAYMYQMAQNSDLAGFAKAHVDQCVFQHSADSDRKNKYGFGTRGFGENIAYDTDETQTVEGMILELWYNEKPYYTYSTKTCQSGEMCGHYTQVVWADSKFLGCGIKFCDSLLIPATDDTPQTTESNAYFLSCNYGPAGNYNNEHPYLIGSEACEMCPNNCVNDELCENSYTVQVCRNEYSNCDELSSYCCFGDMKSDCCITCQNVDCSCIDYYSNCGDFVQYCTTDPTMPTDCCATCQGNSKRNYGSKEKNAVNGMIGHLMKLLKGKKRKGGKLE